jgi:hypothetical protein
MLFEKKSVLLTAALWCLTGCAAQSDAFRRMSAEEHEQLAAAPRTSPDAAASADEHLAAARQLRDVAQAACAEVADSDRDLGPFARKDRIVAIEALKARPYAKGLVQPSGIAVYVRASPGLTVEWMDRVLACHLARRAVVGDGMADRESPLFVNDTRIALSSTGDGFRFTITSRDIDAAREIIEKGRALVE